MGSNYSALPNLDEDDAILAQTDNLNSSRLFSPRKQPIIRPAVHTESINWLCSVRPEMVISGSSDKTIALNNMVSREISEKIEMNSIHFYDTGACLTRWRGHEREVTKVVYKHVECRHFLLSGSKDCTVRLWHFNSSECCQVFTAHQMAVTGLAALDEARFVSGGRDGKMSIWDLERNRPTRTVGYSQNLVTHIETDQEGKILYQTAEDGSLRIWDSKNLSPIDQLPSGSNHAQWHCSISPFFPSLIMTAGGGNLGDGCEIGLWDIRQRKLVQQFRGHESDIRSAIFLHQQQVTWKRLILSVSADRTAKLWDMNSGRCVWTETIPVELNSCVGFSDGSVVIGGGKATLCELRLLVKAGRPFLNCSSIQQSIGE